MKTAQIGQKCSLSFMSADYTLGNCNRFLEGVRTDTWQTTKKNASHPWNSPRFRIVYSLICAPHSMSQLENRMLQPNVVYHTDWALDAGKRWGSKATLIQAWQYAVMGSSFHKPTQMRTTPLATCRD